MMLRRASLLLSLAALGCAMSSPRGNACYVDTDCDPGLVCFANGCGDPAKDVVVEVVPNASSGQHAQDFPVSELRPNHLITLGPPLALHGTLSQEVVWQSPSVQPYTAAPVSIRVSGESAFIPGVFRRYETQVSATAEGAYALPVGMGIFEISATSADASVPPFLTSARVDATASVAVDVLFNGPNGYVASGTLRKTASSPDLPTAYYVQALETKTLLPLSQRVIVENGARTFTLHLSSRVESMSQYTIQATPVGQSVPAPRKTFTVNVSPPMSGGVLELGDFGTPMDVQGSVVKADGKPVAGAAVYFEGTVKGGGEFRSPVGLTGADGRFAIQSLPTASGMPFTVWIFPAAQSTAGIQRSLVQVPPPGAIAFVCPNKTLVRGDLFYPDGAPAMGARVQAVPAFVVSGHPLPATGGDDITDAQGKFEFLLDPATYQIEFLPDYGLPRARRFVEVRGTQAELALTSFSLSHGRTITGAVVVMPRGGASLTPAPFASVRFFRLELYGDKRTAALLDETVTDAYGNYSVTLPGR